MDGALLQLTQVSKSFGGVQAVSNVSLEIATGEIFGLIGPNGAGKTTLFNLISGIFPVSAGSITFDGRDVTGWRASAMARAGLARTFQTVHLFSGLSVLENVMMGHNREALTGLRSLVPVLAERRERALEREARSVLDFLGLHQYAGAPAQELPYAIQRKVELARAIVGRPTLVLLDEPAAGFNEDESGELAGNIRRVRDQGTTVVLIEHDMSVVMDICDRIAVLNFGEKIAEGTTSAIQDDPLVVEAYLGRDDEFATADDSPVVR